MKKHLFILAFAMLLSAASAFAQHVDGGTTGPLTWELTGTGNDLTLTISGQGRMPDYVGYSYGSAPWHNDDYCKSITTVKIENGVTTIGNQAFIDCYVLESITIPNGVTTIGNWAFAGCTTLESTTIPNGVTTIGRSAFFWCIALTSITIPSSVTTIVDGAFENCTALTSITNLNLVPVEIQSSVFKYVDQGACTLKVPTIAVSAYQSAEVWKEFNIEGIDVGIVETLRATSLQVYPNPTMGLLTICDNRMSDVGQFDRLTASQSEIVIYDVMGRVVHVETRHATSLQSQIANRPSQIEINISHLPQGVYGVSVISEGRVVGNGKVVKM